MGYLYFMTAASVLHHRQIYVKGKPAEIGTPRKPTSDETLIELGDRAASEVAEMCVCVSTVSTKKNFLAHPKTALT